jgi:hypothetical protein
MGRKEKIKNDFVKMLFSYDCYCVGASLNYPSFGWSDEEKGRAAITKNFHEFSQNLLK